MTKTGNENDLDRFGSALAEIEHYENCCQNCGLPLKYWNETLGLGMRLMYCSRCDKVFPEENHDDENIQRQKS